MFDALAKTYATPQKYFSSIHYIFTFWTNYKEAYTLDMVMKYV